MEIKRIGGLSAIIAGASLAVGGFASMCHSNQKIDKLERQGYDRSDAEYVEMEDLNKKGQLAVAGATLLTSAGAICIVSGKKKRFLSEVYNPNYGGRK